MAAGKSYQELQAEQLEAQRKAAREASARITDADTARAMADAAARVKAEASPAAPSPIGARMPAAAEVAMGKPGRVFNPKIFDKDIARFKAEKFPALAYIRRCDAVIDAERKPDEVRGVYLKAVVRTIGWGAAQSGKYSKSFRLLASLTAACVETMRKVIRWLEAHRLIDTMNDLERAGRDLWRGPNVYLPLLDAPPEAAADAPAVAPELAPLARATETLNRWATRFGLVARAWGLNATPVASKHTNLRRERDDPAPA